jgi:hypothetical protein
VKVQAAESGALASLSKGDKTMKSISRAAARGTKTSSSQVDATDTAQTNAGFLVQVGFSPKTHKQEIL